MMGCWLKEFGLKDISENIRFHKDGDTFVARQLVFGNGDPRLGEFLLFILAVATQESRDAMPEFAVGPWQGLGRIEDKFSELRNEVMANGEDYKACGILAIETMAEMFRYLAREYEDKA